MLPSLFTDTVKQCSSAVRATLMALRAYFKALLSRLLIIFVTASRSVDATTGSSGTLHCSVLPLSMIDGSKRATVSPRSTQMSTFSYLNVSLLASIFWKSSNWPVRLSRRLVFWRVTLR